MPFIHYGEAKKAASEKVRSIVEATAVIERALLVSDLFGRLRIILWAPADGAAQVRERLASELEPVCGSWWTGEVLRVGDAATSEQSIWESAWAEGRRDVDVDRLRYLERHRSRTAWFVEATAPEWRAPEEGPPIVVFYGFKGGLGRSTVLASFAIQRARLGERVAVVDFDLDAPGVGSLLSADPDGTIAPWGVVDYLIERAQGDVPLDHYYHTCRRVAGSGEITVFPAGRVDEQYADKLARVDLEDAPGTVFLRLLSDMRATLAPGWILLDARTGLSEPAGRLLSGIAHLHVLFGASSDQNWSGLSVVINRLGRQRLLAARPQADVLLVQGMVPATAMSEKIAREAFAERAREVFTDLYYAADPDDATFSEDVWYVSDLDSQDAPHAPVAMPYRERLAHFRDIADVADTLGEGEYTALAERIAGRFRREED
jgi:hypothetical protein